MNPFVVICFILAGVFLLVAIFKLLKPVFRKLERQSVLKFMAELRKDKEMYEADVAEYGEVFNYIEEGLRTGLAGTTKEIGSSFFFVNTESWERYGDYLRHAEISLEKTKDSLLFEEGLLRQLSK